MSDSKINKLQQALGKADQLSLKPNLDAPLSLDKDSNVGGLNLGQKFGGPSLGHDHKSLKDPKGKNKQILKGNAKARRH